MARLIRFAAVDVMEERLQFYPCPICTSIDIKSTELSISNYGIFLKEGLVTYGAFQ